MTVGAVNEQKKTTKNSSSKKQKQGERAPLLPRSNLVGSSGSGHGEFNGASFLGAVFNLSTTIIGAGIMALPAAMKVMGLGLGIATIIFFAFLTEISIDMILRFSSVGGSVSYGSLMGDTFGNFGRKLLQTFVVVNTLGILIVYLIIIGDVLSGKISSGVNHAGILEEWFGEHWWNERTFVLLVMTLFVLAPLACFRHIDSLRFTSALAVALAIVFLLITAGITIYKLVDGTISMPRLFPDVPDLSSVWKLFTVVPVITTAYICHFNVQTIGNELENSSQINSVVKTSLALCSTVYIFTSIFGFLLFGDSILDDVLANFDTNLGVPYSSQLNDAVRISYALHLLLVFPVVFYATRENLDGLLFPSAEPLASDACRFSLISMVLVAVIFLGANFIPSIWVVFQITGATSAVCVGFIFPAAITLRDRHGIATKKDRFLAALMMVLAVFASLVALYSTLYGLIKKMFPQNE